MKQLIRSSWLLLACMQIHAAEPLANCISKLTQQQLSGLKRHLQAGKPLTEAMFLIKKQDSRHRNLIIIGSGPAAMGAAVYAARSELKPLVIEGPQPGGLFMQAERVENWPGERSTSGPDIMLKMRQHAIEFGADLAQEEVIGVDFATRPFKVVTDCNKTYTADSVVIATGTSPQKLALPHEDTYWGKGIAACSLCEGPFYKDKKVMIVGNGVAAIKNALFMAKYTQHLTLVAQEGFLAASPDLITELMAIPGIEILLDTKITAIHGDGNKLQGVDTAHIPTGAQKTLPTDALFVCIGFDPVTTIFKNQLDLNEQGYIKVKDEVFTSTDGVFAAGTVTSRQHSTPHAGGFDTVTGQAFYSTAAGTLAATEAERFLLRTHQDGKGTAKSLPA